MLPAVEFDSEIGSQKSLGWQPTRGIWPTSWCIYSLSGLGNRRLTSIASLVKAIELKTHQIYSYFRKQTET